MTVVSPDNTAARIGVPRFADANTIIYANGNIVWEDGRFTGVTSGLTYDTNDSRYVYFNVQPGTWKASGAFSNARCTTLVISKITIALQSLSRATYTSTTMKDDKGS